MSSGADQVGSIFLALADPTRRDVVRRLAENGSATATQLAGALPMSRQAVSKHLALLEEASLVSPTRTGREVRYALSAEAMTVAMSWMVAVGGRWDERLAALQRHVAASAKGTMRSSLPDGKGRGG